MSNPKPFVLAVGLTLAASWFFPKPAITAAEENGPALAAVQAPATESTNALTHPDAGVESTNLVITASHLEQLQEQQRSLLRAVEQIRQEANATARQNAESLTGRLAAIEQSLAGERQRELEAIQKWNLFTLIVVGGFASLGFLALLLVAPFLVRALNRMTDAAATLQLHDAARPALPGPSPDGTPLLASPAVAQSTARFLDAIDRIERRIHQLEDTVQSPRLSVEPQANGGAKPPSPTHRESLHTTVESPTRSLQPQVRAELVLEKGQALLHLGETERALACFDEAIAVEPGVAEAHIKKGQAFEKLKRTDEALASYDTAIALDKSVATAYLCKGSLLNQLARYDEALKCYELALRVQEGDRSAPST